MDREKFKEKMGKKREEREQIILSSKKGTESIYDERKLGRRVIGAPYRIAASACGVAYKAIANKYFAGAACLAIAFGSGVAYGVKNADDIKGDYNIAVQATTEFVKDALSHLAEKAAEESAEEEADPNEYSVKAYQKQAKEENIVGKNNAKSGIEPLENKSKADSLEGIANDSGEEKY